MSAGRRAHDHDDWRQTLRAGSTNRSEPAGWSGELLDCLISSSRRSIPVGERPALILASQGAEELRDMVNVERRQVSSELSTRHDVDRLQERIDRAVMKIGGSNGHIAEARDAEHTPVALDARNGEATKIR